ncbi:MAG: NYN domain-containing protein [Clostridia bacterium]|nr:NYN domain-containing protein [Clostridia bacterium]
MNDKKFAILIDADNTSDKYLKVIFDEATKEGVLTYKRIYGDWTSQDMQHWKDSLLEYSINPIQQYAYTKGKNATDSAMIIDAMDILYTSTLDGFVLVSSDSDFTRLAARLKESGKIVIGMGKQQTPKPFVSACSKFMYIDILSGENSLLADDGTAKTKANSTLTNQKEITKSINVIIDEHDDENGWVLVSTIGTLMQNKYPDFDCKNYGCKKLIELLKKLGFDTKLLDDKTTYMVRKKQKSK